MFDANASEQDLRSNVSSQCRICSGPDSEESAECLLSTSYWDFFYCSNCRNWFQVAARDNDAAYPINDEKTVSALNYYVEQTLENIAGPGHVLRGALRKIHNLVSSPSL